MKKLTRVKFYKYFWYCSCETGSSAGLSWCVLVSIGAIACDIIRQWL